MDEVFVCMVRWNRFSKLLQCPCCYVASPMAPFSSCRCKVRDKSFCQVSCNDAKYCNELGSSFLFYWPSEASRGVPFRLPLGRAWNGTANAGLTAGALLPRTLQRFVSMGAQRNTNACGHAVDQWQSTDKVTFQAALCGFRHLGHSASSANRRKLYFALLAVGCLLVD